VIKIVYLKINRNSRFVLYAWTDAISDWVKQLIFTFAYGTVRWRDNSNTFSRWKSVMFVVLVTIFYTVHSRANVIVARLRLTNFDQSGKNQNGKSEMSVIAFSITLFERVYFSWFAWKPLSSRKHHVYTSLYLYEYVSFSRTRNNTYTRVLYGKYITILEKRR